MACFVWVLTEHLCNAAMLGLLDGWMQQSLLRFTVYCLYFKVYQAQHYFYYEFCIYALHRYAMNV